MALAHELGRRWIGVDNSVEAIRATLNRNLKGTEPMGDYVKTRKKVAPKHQEPSLFGSLHEQERPQRPLKHIPIVEFEIAAVRENASDIAEPLAEWENATSQEESCHAKEHVSSKTA